MYSFQVHQQFGQYDVVDRYIIEVLIHGRYMKRHQLSKQNRDEALRACKYNSRIDRNGLAI